MGRCFAHNVVFLLLLLLLLLPLVVVLVVVVLQVCWSAPHCVCSHQAQEVPRSHAGEWRVQAGPAGECAELVLVHQLGKLEFIRSSLAGLQTMAQGLIGESSHSPLQTLDCSCCVN
jgi:hypothetical protein